jgi:ABC-type multidrug transport system ATPase subunit/pSer/pThr/pTyr-binding forkhead associated (FHA) protein
MTSSLYVALGGRSWTFDPRSEVTVGRSDSCDIAVDDPRVSRTHLRITFQDGWVLTDLDSTHGTWVGGERVGELRVTGPVTVKLAGASLRLHVGRPPRTDVVTVGRSPDNDIVLGDVRVSRHHARIERTDAGWRVSDLGGRNTTLVNASPVREPTLLFEGDRLTFGGTDIVLRGDDFMPAGTTNAELVARNVGYQVPGRTLLVGVDLDAAPGELIAIVGSSGAGKSTLLKVLTGRLRPTTGQVEYGEHDVHDDFAAVATRIGLVPQEDLVHARLTARQALTYAATLRLPEDTTKAERAAAVAEALTALEMDAHADTQISRLSGGQRKRVSVALELLTSPSLLLLDEPTSGLDPALDRHLMTGLRAIADAGRIVVVVTHNVNNLNLCDRVLVLAAGGVPLRAGKPADVLRYFGTKDWADVLGATGTAPPPPAAPRLPAVSKRAVPARRPPSVLRQVRTLAARHVRLVLADPGYALFLLVLPIALGVLALAVPGDSGLREPGEAGQILVLLFVGAAFMGGAASAREVIGERPIVMRELASGVSPLAYATAKAAVFIAICAVESALLVGVLTAVKPSPAAPVVLPQAVIEIYLAVWGTAAASCLLGLLGSALVRSAEQAMPVLVVTVMGQLVLCGGMIPVTGRLVLSELSWLAPARWGYAAGAGTADLTTGAVAPIDRLWTSSWSWWLLSVGILAVMATVHTGLLILRMRRLARR